MFTAPEIELGIHPDGGTSHEISFSCDDLEATVAELKAKGVEFTRAAVEESWGFQTWFRIPGGREVQLFQPKYSRDG